VTDATPESFRRTFETARDAIGRAVVGHDDVVEQTLVAIFAGGHCLLEGVPGIGKTLLVRTVAATLSLPFSRIQFTPDLMPADVVGADLLVDRAGAMTHEFREGPIFGSVVLADEVNRATPKTQSALLQAMEEREVTVSRRTHPLPRPFFVLATQNPIEMEGTYPLPEAQLDRFLFKVLVPTPSLAELLRIVDLTTGGAKATVSAVADGPAVLAMQELAREVVLAPHLREFVGRLVLATHPDVAESPALVKKVVRFGASPRAAQGLVLGAKVRALAHGRAHVAEEDLRKLAPAVLRHRLLLNFEGEADGVTTDRVAAEVLAAARA
jgi:MoxR-like ATPase